MEKVRLRNLLHTDKDLIFQWILDADLRKMIGTRGIPTREDHDIWFKKKVSDNSNEIMIIEYDSSPVGIVGTNCIDLINRNAEMFIYIGDKKNKGKGIAKEAVGLFVNYLNKLHGLHKINARIFSFNKPSIRLFEKCGFVLEGRLIEQVYLSENDEYYDLIWYSLFV